MSLEGQYLGKYRLISCVGHGGFAEVYLAEDTRIHHKVAIKVLQTEELISDEDDKEVTRLFFREVKVVAMLNHRNIPTLIEFGQQVINGVLRYYLVMPFFKEKSLNAWLKYRKPAKLSLKEVAYIISEVADALQCAHDQNIIHQDVKPSNILIRERRDHPDQPDILLTDFGVAGFITPTGLLSQPGRGTREYWAPELSNNQSSNQSSPASDQYSLAVTAYQLLTRKFPSFKEGPASSPPPPSSLNSEVPKEVDTVILKALAKNPEKRYPSVSEFAQEFERAARSDEKGSDIRITLVLNESEAKLGTEYPITLASGHLFPVHVPPDIQDGKEISFPGMGTSAELGKSGDLIVTIVVRPNPDKDQIITKYLEKIYQKTDAVPQPIFNDPLERYKGIQTWVAIPLLCLMLILGSVGFVSLSKTNQATLDSTNANATAIALNATVFAQVQATALVKALNPYPSYLPREGSLALYDSLTNDSSGYDWDINAGCSFIDGAYHSSESQQGYYYSSCFAKKTNFNNFAYQVGVTIIRGNCGGIIFRSQKPSNFYIFEICQNQNYHLWLISNGKGTSIASSYTSYINNGLNRFNLIALAAIGSSFYLYVNQQEITQVIDNTYIQGEIGVAVDAGPYPTEAVFTDAKVWTF